MRLSDYGVCIEFQEWDPYITKQPFCKTYVVTPQNKNEFTVRRVYFSNGILCVSHNGYTIGDAMIEENSQGERLIYYVAYTPIDYERVERVGSEMFRIDEVDDLVGHFLEWLSNQQLKKIHKVPFLAEIVKYASS